MMHWGLYAVPAHGSEWYEKHMYGNPGITQWHTEHYGPPDRFGYKDFIPLFTAEQFDPDAWASLFKQSGAKYVIPTAEHHDGFALWDSQVNPWNAKQMGPKRDLIGDLAAAVRKQGLKFGVSHHGMEHFNFITPTKGLATDLADPKWAGFYGVADRSEAALTRFLQGWVAENFELIDKYQPDILWFDNGVNPRVLDPLKLKVAAYYYDRADAWNKQVSLSTKGFDSPDGPACLSGSIMDFERSSREPKSATDFVWEVDEPVLRRFGYTTDPMTTTPDRIIRLLVDCVSKNGTLLLNLSPKADGTIPPEQQQLLLAIGKWLSTNGEAIYGTRPWSQFSDGSARYTTKGDALYATFIGRPGDATLLKALTPEKGKVSAVTLLSSGAPLKFTQTDAGLQIELPAAAKSDIPAVKIQGIVGAHAQAPASTEIFADALPNRRPIVNAQPRGNRFDLRTTKDSYIVTTGAHTTFTVSRVNGDITSMTYDGIEAEAPYKITNRNSHYASGLGKDSKITATGDPAGNWIKIIVDDAGLGVTQYYVAKKGVDAIFMGTYADKLPHPGEMRFLVYLDRKALPNVPIESNNSDTDAGVEGKDVFVEKSNGHTHSKFYAATPFIDDLVHGATGPGIGVFVNTGNRETASGGPFFRDIEYQTTGGATEMYIYMYSGHTQTEPFRPGLHGPYAQQFTAGDKPGPLDDSFLAEVGMKGYVPASGRGAVAGEAGPVADDLPRTIGLSSAAAEYWGRPDGSGQFKIVGVKPGTYTETLYQNELAVGTRQVTVSPGQTTRGDITATRHEPPAVFRIGRWDGTPEGFLNADKIHDMHPSDSRMAPWTERDFIVGQSKDSDWPLAQFKEINGSQKIRFNLTAAQAKQALTLRIGITLAYAGGVPQVIVNAGEPHAWTSPVPPFSEQP
ncbi:MAG: alpha-L-fucosidase, partial [Tepidisphaeraceae bacterium]